MVESHTTSVTPATHASRHSVGGADPLADPIMTSGHHATHEVGGSDIVDFDTTMTDVTASRALGTNYQNTTGKVLFICALVSATGTDNVQIYGVCKVSSPPDVVVTGSFATDNTELMPAFFIVPKNYYYKVYATTGAVSLYSWVEWTL